MSTIRTYLTLLLNLLVINYAIAEEGHSFNFSRSPNANNNNASGSGSGVSIVVGENYVLKPSDVINVEVYQEPDLNKIIRIEGDGSVELALVGKVKIAGMTIAEAQSLITDLYNRDYLVNPQISVLVSSFAPQYINILGSVNQPGVVAIPPDRPITLTEAIAGVNGISRLGNPKAIIIKRKNEDGSIDQIEINFTRILIDNDVTDIVLQVGDTVWVPERII
jgi:polysaccharide export outer membrane protein